MKNHKDGQAIVYCQGAFNTPYGKTAHGLVRFTTRYDILSVLDSHYAGQDAGAVLDEKPRGIPVCAAIEDALVEAQKKGQKATHFVIGLAPDGGRLDPAARADVKKAIEASLHVDSGLHDFLSEDPEFSELAKVKRINIRDIRKPPAVKDLHFFCGKIEAVKSKKIAVLGTDSAIGKRTTAWLLVKALENADYKTEMVGTGQTAWLQGVRYGIILDSLINDFVAGEIEHAVWSAWKGSGPDVIVIEGQGSLMNPAYPGGFEILAAGRPDFVILQHAPFRLEYDGFPGYPIQPLPHQIKAIEILSGKKVAAITINHENVPQEKIPALCQSVEKVSGLPSYDVLIQGAEKLVDRLKPLLEK